MNDTLTFFREQRVYSLRLPAMKLFGFSHDFLGCQGGSHVEASWIEWQNRVRHVLEHGAVALVSADQTLFLSTAAENIPRRGLFKTVPLGHSDCGVPCHYDLTLPDGNGRRVPLSVADGWTLQWQFHDKFNDEDGTVEPWNLSGSLSWRPCFIRG